MFWYKNLPTCCRAAGLGLLFSFTNACKPELKETGARIRYFDIKGYFKNEAKQLGRINPSVNKWVRHNGDAENRKLKITNWAAELNLFTEADINKPAWSRSYTIDSSANGLTYKAIFSQLKTRKIIITKQNGKVTRVTITNDIHNLLYSTAEKLTYLPGEFYLIEKTQHVKLTGTHTYIIKGEFK